jgi:probable rRNA maturation factor
MKTETHACIEVEVQYASDAQALPSRQDFCRWVQATLADAGSPVGVVIRVVDEPESRELNQRYRGKDQPTNVLSFPFEAPAVVASNHLGDLIVCAPVVAREAQEQHKLAMHHWAHMVVHGVLHLRGYDHQSKEEALDMETLEISILEQLGVADPYAETDVAVQ